MMGTGFKVGIQDRIPRNDGDFCKTLHLCVRSPEKSVEALCQDLSPMDENGSDSRVGAHAADPPACETNAAPYPAFVFAGYAHVTVST
jgi:hypothetical protein